MIGADTYLNPRAGMPVATGTKPTSVLTYVNKRTGEWVTRTLTGMKDLSSIAIVAPFLELSSGTEIGGLKIAFTDADMPKDARSLSNIIFELSNGSISQCTGRGGLLVCSFYNEIDVRTDVPLPTAPKLAGDGESKQTIPFCTGAIVDAGFGSTTRVTLEQANCDAAPDKTPVRLDVDKTYAAVEGGMPLADSGDGSITFTPTELAAGQYVPSLVYAISEDGTESWPFYVIFRVRNAPEINSSGASIETMRSVDSVVGSERMFSDIDVDTFQAETHDKLTPQIVSAPGRGTAWFDAGGDLHYRPLNLTEAYSDRVVVKAVDSFGYSSPELTIPITVSDVRPGCDTGFSTTDSRTPVTVDLHCWLTAPDGWTQRPGEGLEYTITGAPASGTLTNLDPVSGRALYTPSADTEGPMTITFTGEYNGQVRESVFTVMVLPAP